MCIRDSTCDESAKAVLVTARGAAPSQSLPRSCARDRQRRGGRSATKDLDPATSRPTWGRDAVTAA
eukprot:633998-Alexandrium_andersonii.AAC.1